MISIRKKLLFGLFIGAILCISVITVILFLEIREEMYEIMDYQMEQIALVHRLQSYPREIDTRSGFEEDKIDSLVQIWDSSYELVYTNDRSMSISLSSRNGFSVVTWGGQKWRVLLEEGPLKIQVAQSMKLRQRVVFLIALKFSLVMLLFLFLLGGWIVFIVRNSFKPLRDVRKQIRERKASLLAPIPDKGVPEEILPLVTELNYLLSRLDRSLKSQKQFLADAAHELRTPLTALDLQIQNARYAMAGQNKEIFIQKLKRGVDRASAMINQLLTISRMESGFLKNEVSDVDLNRVITRVFSDHSDMDAETGIVLDSMVHGQITMRGNAGSLEVMISSLIDNAIKYSPSETEVKVDILQTEVETVIAVMDQGPGIPEEEREKVFQRFYRYQGQRVLGSGLGLSIVKDISEFRNGKISLAEGPGGRGLQVRITFPAFPGDDLPDHPDDKPLYSGNGL